MSTFTIEVEMPEELRDLGYSDAEMQREIPMFLVLKRFREGGISSGKAARIMGLSRREFLDLLAKEGIPLYEPTDEQLADELKTVDRLGPDQP